VVPEDRGKAIDVQGPDVHGPSSEFTTSQDFVSGIMKIVPSDVAVSITSFSETFVLRITILMREYIYGNTVSKLWGIIFQNCAHIYDCIFCMNFCNVSLQSEADYWLLSDADVSITDMWRTERIPLNFLASFSFFRYVMHPHTPGGEGFGSFTKKKKN